jgi:hypothetical protein
VRDVAGCRLQVVGERLREVRGGEVAVVVEEEEEEEIGRVGKEGSKIDC